MKCILLTLVTAVMASLGQAAMPTFDGYSLVQVGNAKLPVSVHDETKDADVPIWLLLPSTDLQQGDPRVSRVNECSVAAPMQTALPASLAEGYTLRLMNETYAQPTEVDGELVSLDVPLFAYVPSAKPPITVKAPSLVEVLSHSSKVTVLPSPSPLRLADSKPVTRAHLVEVARSVEAPGTVVSHDGDAVALNAPISDPVANTPPTDGVKGEPSQQGPAAPTSSAEPAIPATLAELAKRIQDAPTKSSVKVTEPGDIVTTQSDLYRRAPAIKVTLDELPLATVLKALAKEARISFDLSDDIPKRTVTAYYVLSPFSAMEKIAASNDVEVSEEDGVFHVRKLQPDALVFETYKLQNISLGTSSTASGSQTTGAGFQNMGSQLGSGSMSGSGFNSSSNGGLVNGNSNASIGQAGGMNSLNSSTGGRSLAANQGSNNILMNLRNLLALQASYRMEGADGVIHNPLGGDANPSGTGKTNLRGSIDYDAAHNQLSIVATRKQMEWVKRYLKSVDVPTARIGLDVLFVESDINPSESFGIDHSATLGKGFTVATPKDVSWGTTSLPSLPTGVALSSGALQATLNAWVSNKAAHITQRPAVVTRPDQDVCISTTKDIPIISNASVTSGLASTGGSSNVPGSSSGALQTGFSSDTQTIGTTLRLRAYPVNANRFSLVVRLEISSPDQSVSAGESLTGRIPTTVTTYEGEFEVSRGETLAIGGLERVEDDLSSGRVPVLGRIPFLGFAFKTKTRSLQKSHLTIFVTPNMIETALDGRGTAATSAEGSQQQLEMTRGLREKALRAEQKLERE